MVCIACGSNENQLVHACPTLDQVSISQEYFRKLKDGIIERDKTINGLLAALEQIKAMPTWAHGEQTRLICKEAIARAGR